MVCARGHDSAEADFCSVCGVRMPVTPVGVVETCPDCALTREPGSGKFCEFCGYNFSTGEHGAQGAAPVPRAPRDWEVSIEVDPSLRTEESPEAPAGFQPTTIRLTAESSLIGRKSEMRGIFPEISLDRDDAVSHRHALLNRLPGGALIVRDIGSSNGTRLNGAELPQLTDVPLKAGDRLTLGHWTRIGIRNTEEHQ